MQITDAEAAKSLDDIDAITRKVKQSLFFRRVRVSILLWGVLTFIGYLSGHFYPASAWWIWRGVYVVGITGTIFAGTFSSENGQGMRFDARMFFAFILFFVFGMLWTDVLGAFSPRQRDAFWPTYFMLAYTLLGLWAGTAFVVIGLAITALTVASYFLSGSYFGLTMAAVNGLGLILAGLWMWRQ
jgi:hypothetical protein